MDTYFGKNGKVYQLGEKLGAGGEGAAYRIAADPSLVAKIYHASSDHQAMQQKCRKIEAMIALPFQPTVDGILRAAWPKDILKDASGNFVGYVMPCVSTPYEIFQVYRDDADRERILPGFTWKYSVQYAYNLSWVVWYMHMNNIVIGDMNMKNIRIDERGQVVLIDCDSFDITDPKTKEHFPCTVGLPELLAPELQNVGSLVNGKFSQESDDFSLAIHIFRLLMKNADPFGARLISKKKSSRSAVNASGPIVNGECVYVRNVPGKVAPAWVPPFEMLPADIRHGFEKTFNYTALTAVKNKKNRTTAAEWNQMLLKLAMKEPNPMLKRCGKDARHIYPLHNQTCPWCGSNSLVHDNGIAKKYRNMTGY